MQGFFILDFGIMKFHPFFFRIPTEVASRHLHSQRVHYQRTSPLEFGNQETEVFTIKHIHSTRLNFRVDEFSGCFFCLFFTEPNDGNGGLNLFFFVSFFFLRIFRDFSWLKFGGGWFGIQQIFLFEKDYDFGVSLKQFKYTYFEIVEVEEREF